MSAFEVWDDGTVLLNGIKCPAPTENDDGKTLVYNHDMMQMEFAPFVCETPAITSAYEKIFLAGSDTSLDIHGIDEDWSGSHDKNIIFKINPEENTGALVAFVSKDGENFDTEGDYSYSSAVFDNDPVPKIYGSNGDNRAHLTPNFPSNLIGQHGIEGDAVVVNPERGTLITRVRGTGSYNEPDHDTNFFLFSFAREEAQILKSLRLRVRDKNTGDFIKFSGSARLLRR